ncbi:MAG TPA: hypothetical protein VMV44_11310, partial [Rectinemataceae bacterium]|nr:hypothetical protein [Rectinemataceae bacterium]
LEEEALPDFETGTEDAKLPEAEAFPEAESLPEPSGLPETEALPETTELPEADFFSEALPDFGEATEGPQAAGGTLDFPMEEGASIEGEESLPDLSADFDLPSIGEASPEATAQASAPAAEEIETPDLGDFDFSSEAGGEDAFDSFSFGEPPNPALAGDALDRELANLGSDSGQAATFNLDGNWGSVDGLEEAPPPRPEARPQAQARAKEEKPVRPLALSDAQVDRLQDSLLALPLNLRVAVEDVVANEKGSEAQRTDLVWMLVEGASTGDIATAAGKILRRRIAIPEDYVHRTGAGYLAEKGSLRYVLSHTVLPIVRTALLALLIVSTIGFLGYRYIWRPLVANQIYREGYQRIQQDRYPEAEDAFARATGIREFVPWYYRYAQAYAKKRLWIYAENKYADLLTRHPAEKKGALEWAGIERDQLKYREGIDILNKWILDRKNTDPDALLLEGDIFLEWGDEDPGQYEQARKRFASLIQFYGAKDLYLERMLQYFMRVDTLAEVLPLKDHFLAESRDPLSALTLAELGGYLLDHKQMTDDFRILKAALAKDPSVPETHWQLHRYYRVSGDRGDELSALDNSISLFERLSALGRRRLSMYLEALIRRGDMGIEDRQYLRAEADFGKAVLAYQNGLDIGRLKPTLAFARAWAGLGDVSYLAKDDLEAARQFYKKAADNGWDNPEIRYRRGFIAYRQGRFDDALQQFWISKRGGNDSPFLEWALGSSFAQRGDWNAAESSFRSLVDGMGDKFNALDYPLPQDKLYDRNVTELLMEAQNNLGVSLFHLGNRMGDAKLKAKAILAFTESARLFDLIVHDERSLVGANAANLGYANLDYVLHPKRGIDISAYEGIQKDDSWSER